MDQCLEIAILFPCLFTPGTSDEPAVMECLESLMGLGWYSILQSKKPKKGCDWEVSLVS